MTHQTHEESLYEVQGRVKDTGQKYYFGKCTFCDRPTCSMRAVQTLCDECEKTADKLRGAMGIISQTEEALGTHWGIVGGEMMELDDGHLESSYDERCEEDMPF